MIVLQKKRSLHKLLYEPEDQEHLTIKSTVFHISLNSSPQKVKFTSGDKFTQGYELLI